ncbi:hypothetical protein ABBQ38_004501 [Trebouxia sp. C0009 RCD-2024]
MSHCYDHGSDQDLHAWLLQRRQPKPVRAQGPEPAIQSSPLHTHTAPESYPEPENVLSEAAFQSAYWASMRARAAEAANSPASKGAHAPHKAITVSSQKD